MCNIYPTHAISRRMSATKKNVFMSLCHCFLISLLFVLTNYSLFFCVCVYVCVCVLFSLYICFLCAYVLFHLAWRREAMWQKKKLICCFNEFVRLWKESNEWHSNFGMPTECKQIKCLRQYIQCILYMWFYFNLCSLHLNVFNAQFNELEPLLCLCIVCVCVRL